MVSAPSHFRVCVSPVSKIETVALPAKSGGNDSPPDFVRQISQSRIYQDYEWAFAKTTKLPLELYSIDTCREVHRIRGNYANPVCGILAEANKTCVACPEVRRKLAGGDISDTQTVTCFAGLTYTRVPLKFYDRVIGILQIGQVFLGAPSARRFKKIATRVFSSGMMFNLPRLEDAYFRSRAVSPDQYRAVVRLLEIFAEHLSLIFNQVALHKCNRDSRIVRRAKDYIADHKFEPVKLEQMARVLNISTFHFCRRFKLETGLTFVEYLSRVRIEQAKLLLHNTHLRISEIAYEIGFQSLTHFNIEFCSIFGLGGPNHRG